MRGLARILPLFSLPAACTPTATEPPHALELLAVLPKDGQGVLLNEPLDFYFSGPLERSSVVSGMRVLDEGGGEARGRLQVDGATVRFEPEAALSSDLSDGGLRPDRTYAVELRGFPRPDALRGSDGAPLARTYRWVFHTVALGAGALFVDDNPDQPATLRFATPRVAPDEPIVFLGDEPIDPTTLADDVFRLYALEGEPAGPYPLRARLVRELSARSTALRGQVVPGAALLEVESRVTLPPGRYRLEWRVDHGVRDYAGANVLITGLTATHADVEVTDVMPRARGELFESFLDTSLLSPVPVPGVDGTAYWGESGRVELLRYPAAAGTGNDGEVVLGEEEPRRDLHATRLRLPSGVRCELDATAGLVVLRAQGRMDVSGELVRHVGLPLPDKWTKNPFARPWRLTAWIEHARTAEDSWTVLIAGGDLVVDGSIEVDGPLLLVAGGVVRIAGKIHEPLARIYITTDEDEAGVGSMPSIHVIDRRKGLLTIDPPLENQLKEELRFAVLSAPLPQRGTVNHWLAANVRGERNSGSYSVRYVDGSLPPHDVAPSAVPDPRFLEGVGTLRFLVELIVPPRDPRATKAAPWDPPFVDDVQIVWN